MREVDTKVASTLEVLLALDLLNYRSENILGLNPYHVFLGINLTGSLSN